MELLSTTIFKCRIDMTPLLTKDTMDVKAEIRNAGKQKVGVLVLKAAWL